jgi:molecular chaperone GrpE
MKEEKEKDGGIPQKKHMEEIEKCKKDIKDMEHNWKRALADYKNLEKRIQEDKEQLVFYIKKQTIEMVLPFLDNLEKIDEHLKDKGLELTIKDFKQTLKDLGVEEIEVKDKQYDSSTMDAIETEDGEKDKVLKIVSKGYLLNGKLLRPAKVVVGK